MESTKLRVLSLHLKRAAKRYYHGTSSKFLDNIKRNGLLADSGNKVWEDSLEAMPGHVYVTDNIVVALDYAGKTSNKFGGKHLLLVLDVTGPIYLDEDFLLELGYRISKHDLNRPTDEREKYFPLLLKLYRNSLTEYTNLELWVLQMVLSMESITRNLGAMLDTIMSWESRNAFYKEKMNSWGSGFSEEDMSPEKMNRANHNFLKLFEEFLHDVSKGTKSDMKETVEFLSSDIVEKIANPTGGSRKDFWLKHREEFANRFPNWFSAESGISGTFAVEAENIHPKEYWVVEAAPVRNYSDLEKYGERV